jgi:hypothetical protein
MESRDIDEVLDDEELLRACPICDGMSIPLGQLGKLVWYICLDCGIQFNTGE